MSSRGLSLPVNQRVMGGCCWWLSTKRWSSSSSSLTVVVTGRATPPLPLFSSLPYWVRERDLHRGP
ncbi:hypothetical protein HanIR_Chr04g0154901 [Helianthus annuus]|nr:hypothetical protein HanIR_Chr04g0154901 [Helianthus annuus]